MSSWWDNAMANVESAAGVAMKVGETAEAIKSGSFGAAAQEQAEARYQPTVEYQNVGEPASVAPVQPAQTLVGDSEAKASGFGLSTAQMIGGGVAVLALVVTVALVLKD